MQWTIRRRDLDGLARAVRSYWLKDGGKDALYTRQARAEDCVQDYIEKGGRFSILASGELGDYVCALVMIGNATNDEIAKAVEHLGAEVVDG